MADISMFATKDNADNGVLFPVVIDGTKMPIAIKIYGDDSDVVHNYNTKRLKKLKIGSTGINVDEDTLEEFLDSNENVIIRIAGVYSYDWEKGETTDEPIVLNGKTIECNKKSYEYLLEKIPSIKDFVLKKSGTRSNFLDSGKKD